MNTTIIGLGLMGGSMAKSLKENKISNHIIGVDSNKQHCEKALKLNLVDEIHALESACKNSTLIIVATPVVVSKKIITSVLNNCTNEQIIIDLGSTKATLCEHLKQHKNRKQYVAAHPIAGTENSGPSAAIERLYQNKKVVICEKNLCSDEALSVAIELFNKIGMTTIFMSPESHDKHLAYISHLSHISSFALGLTVLDLEKGEENIFNLAGSGFSSTVRLAKSSPEMWKAIFTENKNNILPALEAYINHLQSFKINILNENEEVLKIKMSQANNIKKILK